MLKWVQEYVLNNDIIWPQHNYKRQKGGEAHCNKNCSIIIRIIRAAFSGHLSNIVYKC